LSCVEQQAPSRREADLRPDAGSLLTPICAAASAQACLLCAPSRGRFGAVRLVLSAPTLAKLRETAFPIYQVYLNVAPGSVPAPDDSGYVGTLNFFSIHGEHAGHGGGPVLTFSVFNVLRKLESQGRNASAPTVPLVPEGDFAPAAEPRSGVNEIK
jgi:hypothetical protein